MSDVMLLWKLNRVQLQSFSYELTKGCR